MNVAHELAERLAPLIAAFQKDDVGIVVDVVVIAAYADGEIDDEELAVLRVACESAFGAPMPVETARGHIDNAKAQIKAASGDAFARQVGKLLAARNMGEAGLRLGFTIAIASRGVSDEERDRLIILGEGAGITESRVRRIEQEATVG